MALVLDTKTIPSNKVDFYFDNPGAAVDDIEHMSKVLRACQATLAGEPGSSDVASLVAELKRIDECSS